MTLSRARPTRGPPFEATHRRDRGRPRPPDRTLPRPRLDADAARKVKARHFTHPPRAGAERRHCGVLPATGTGTFHMVTNHSSKNAVPDTQVLTDAIKDFGTAKEVARVIGCSERTAATYQNGKYLPKINGLARLMRHSRAIADAVLRMAGLDDISLDLEEARLIRELREFQAKRAEPRHGHTAPDAEGASPAGLSGGKAVGAHG
jgi:hypothetical protein